MRSIVKAACFVVLGACAPTLAGQLHKPSGEALVSSEGRVNVTPLTASQPQASLVMAIDGAGRFVTKHKLPPGDYLVEVLVPGYAPQSQKINLATTHELDLIMRPLPAVKVQATHVQEHDGASRGGGSATLLPPSL